MAGVVRDRGDAVIRRSLNARRALDQDATDEVEIVLIGIEHPDLDELIKLSTDPTERLSIEPLKYGTRSAWLADEYPEEADEPFKFVLVSTWLPSDKDDAPAAATIILDEIDANIAEAFRSTTEQATVHMAVVLASSPDDVEMEHRGLKLVSADGDANQVRLTITREPITEESWPAHRMTKQRFPGLHR